MPQPRESKKGRSDRGILIPLCKYNPDDAEVNQETG
jgi:hypothetical protein